MKAIKYIPLFHRSQLIEWWKDRDFPIIPEEMLSDSGFIIPGFCAAWLYKTNSQVALIQWIISNPNTIKEERNQALNLLLESMVEYANREGFKHLICFNSVEALDSRLESIGFMNANEKHNILLKMSGTNG